MKLKVLKCPECRANLEIEDGLHTCFCKYCGCQIMLDEEKQEYTINKNINISKTVRHTDDADIIRAENEANESSRGFKQFLIIWGLLIAFIIIGVVGFKIYGAMAQRDGKINAGYYKDLIGKDYETVETHFEAAGFTDIELIDLGNSGLAFWNEGKVDTISVGGDTSFESTDWFYPDTKVVISYH